MTSYLLPKAYIDKLEADRKAAQDAIDRARRDAAWTMTAAELLHERGVIWQKAWEDRLLGVKA